MTEVTLKVHKKNDPPLDFSPPSGLVVHVPDKQTFVLLEGGMVSGEPSIAILGISQDGVGVMMETSLDKLLMAANGMRGLAENQLGWEQPEGNATVMSEEISQERWHYDDKGLIAVCLAKACPLRHANVVWRKE